MGSWLDCIWIIYNDEEVDGVAWCRIQEQSRNDDYGEFQIIIITYTKIKEE